VRVIFNKLLRSRDNLHGNRVARWIITVCAVGLGVLFTLLPTSTEQEGALNHLAGVTLVVVGALFLIYTIICEYLIIREGHVSSEEWDRQEEERRAREGVEQAAKIAALYGAPYEDSQPDAPWSS
jgi:hypothetical protein